MLKSQLRKLMLNKRELSDFNSQLICNKLLSHFDFSKIKIIHIFLPIIEKKEINTFLILKEIYSKYKHIITIVPVVDLKNKVLLHKYYHENIQLHKNKYNIPEPINSKIFTDLQKIDMILVPLLAFDKSGNRIGYGGGYYDKFLSQCNGLKVGISFEPPIDTIKDVNQYDIKLDYCITPHKVYFFL